MYLQLRQSNSFEVTANSNMHPFFRDAPQLELNSKCIIRVQLYLF